MKKIVKHLTDELRKPRYRGNKNLMAGHCYVASEVAFHLYPGKYKSFFIRHEGEPHWFLKEVKTGKVVDLTASQFKTIPNYANGVGKGFLTKNPSRRAQVVLQRIKNTQR